MNHTGSHIRRTVLGTTLLVSMALSSFVTATGANAAPRAPNLGRDPSALEAQILEWMNGLRDRHDARALRADPEVARYARRHSERMADRGRLFHSSAAQLEDLLRGTGWSTFGENIGYGGSLSALKRLWLDSPPHRANILNRRYDHAGVGVVITARRIWATVFFYG